MAVLARIVIYWGVVFGILAQAGDIIYVIFKQFDSMALHSACGAFVIIQPVWYFFLYFIYIAANSHISSQRERMKLLLLSPLYTILQYLKLLGASTTVHTWMTGNKDG